MEENISQHCTVCGVVIEKGLRVKGKCWKHYQAEYRSAHREKIREVAAKRRRERGQRTIEEWEAERPLGIPTEKLQGLVDAGVATAKMAKELGISRARVYQLFKLRGIKR